MLWIRGLHCTVLKQPLFASPGVFGCSFTAWQLMDVLFEGFLSTRIP